MNYGNGAKTRHLKIDYTKPVFRKHAIENSMAMRKPVLQFTKNGVFLKRFNSAAEASRELHFRNNSHISECCKHSRGTAYGYIWKYERSDDLSESHV